MSVKEIKQHWILACDICGEEKTQTGTHRPSKWIRIRVEADALDYQGAAVADASRELLLCNGCGAKVVHAMNAAAVPPHAGGAA